MHLSVGLTIRFRVSLGIMPVYQSDSSRFCPKVPMSYCSETSETIQTIARVFKKHTFYDLNLFFILNIYSNFLKNFHAIWFEHKNLAPRKLIVRPCG